MTRLQEQYKSTIKPAMLEKFGYANVMQVPRLEKVVLNMGVGEAVQDSKKIQASVDDFPGLQDKSRW